MIMAFASLTYDNKKKNIHRGEVTSRNGQSNSLESFNINNREILPQSRQWLSAHAPGKDATDIIHAATVRACPTRPMEAEKNLLKSFFNVQMIQAKY